jgi:hypothetical protein
VFVFAFVSEVGLFCALVLLFSQQATKRSGKARRQAMWCAWGVLIAWLASDFGVLAYELVFVYLCIWRFGGFGAKLGTFKSSKLYNVIAM